jgi:hypothetical protein
MFQVRWEDTALNELAALWIQAEATLREEITTATSQIDEELEANPYVLGESRPEGRRILFIYPLGVLFRIEQDEQTISVLHIWQFQRHNQ